MKKASLSILAIALMSNSVFASQGPIPCDPFIETKYVDCILERGEQDSFSKKCASLKFYDPKFQGEFPVSEIGKSQVTAIFFKKRLNDKLGICLVDGEVSHAVFRK